jgi:hypothetical protein
MCAPLIMLNLVPVEPMEVAVAFEIAVANI